MNNASSQTPPPDPAQIDPSSTIPSPTTGRAQRLANYSAKANPLIALISLFYLVVMFLRPMVFDSVEASRVAFAFDFIFWLIIAVDIVYRLWLSPPGRKRWVLLISLFLVLIGALLFTGVSEPTRVLIRILLMLLVAFRAAESVQYFLRLRSILYIISAVALTVILSGMAVAVVERDASNASITSVGDGFWWAVVTITTVGYGQLYPVTLAGKIIATVVMIFGVALVSILTATLAQVFVNPDKHRAAEIQGRLDHIEQKINSQQQQPATRPRTSRRPPRTVPPPKPGGVPSSKQE